MSSQLAIGAVSAVLRNLLDNGMVDSGVPLGSIKVTAVAPDTIKLDVPEAPPSLNLFLYRVTPNIGWRNASLPAYGGNGDRLANPPLALDLHYLLTAYGTADFHAEILLGYAMLLLHERPVLDRASIRTALDPSPLGATILPPAFAALTAADLADQIEAVTVTPETMDTEEMSRLWSAIQAHYRPTAAYVVSVVLIEGAKTARRPLPVLSRGVVVEPGLLLPYPTLTRAAARPDPTAATLGGQVRLEGHHLDGTAAVVRFAHRLLSTPNEVAVGVSPDSTGIDVTLPLGAAAEAAWPAGLYSVTVSLVRPGEAAARDSNAAGMLLAPVPGLPPTSITRDPGTRRVTVILTVAPQVRPAQEARLMVGGDAALANPHPAATSTLTFVSGDLPAGHQWVRLTVDGVESPLVDRSKAPPVFAPTQFVAVPA